MRVTAVETFLVYDSFVFCKLSTDEGISGWGEAVFHGHTVTAYALQRLGDQLLGADAEHTERIWHQLFRENYRMGPSGVLLAAISAIDIALHDIKGKALNTPVWNLLGGKLRDHVPVYASLMRQGRDPAAEAEKVAARIDQGYSWVKLHTGAPWSFDAGEDATIETVQAVRHAVDDKVELLVDVNHTYTVPSAIRVGRVLEALQVRHFEEPIAPWDIDGYRKLTNALDIPIAAGEQEHNLWQFRDLILRGGVDIIQPNLTACGGYTQATKIAALAEAFNIPITFHNTEPTLMTAASLHLWATTTMCLYPQEYYGEDQHPLRDTTPILTKPLQTDHGQLTVPNKPGLGVEIDEETIRHLNQTHQR